MVQKSWVMMEDHEEGRLMRRSGFCLRNFLLILFSPSFLRELFCSPSFWDINIIHLSRSSSGLFDQVALSLWGLLSLFWTYMFRFQHWFSVGRTLHPPSGWSLPPRALSLLRASTQSPRLCPKPQLLHPDTWWALQPGCPITMSRTKLLWAERFYFYAEMWDNEVPHPKGISWDNKRYI